LPATKGEALNFSLRLDARKRAGYKRHRYNRCGVDVIVPPLPHLGLLGKPYLRRLIICF